MRFLLHYLTKKFFPRFFLSISSKVKRKAKVSVRMKTSIYLSKLEHVEETLKFVAAFTINRVELQVLLYI